MVKGEVVFGDDVLNKGIDNNFSDALAALKRGSKIALKGWAEHNYLIIQCARVGKDLVTAIAMSDGNGNTKAWVPDSEAILSEKWIIAEDEFDLLKLKEESKNV